MHIGFIGTGTMGTPIAGCLVAAGHRLTVYDIRREATETLRQQSAAVGETPRALAEASEVVFTSLPGPNEVEAAALDPETGLLAGLADGGVYIDLDRKSTRLNSSHVKISYAVFCLKKKKQKRVDNKLAP